MFLVSLHSPAARDLSRDALRVARLPHSALPILGPLDGALESSEHPGVIVHDFRPAPTRSVAWLDGIVLSAPRLTVFALVERPLTPVLDAVVRRAHTFSLSGIAVVPEETAAGLARRFRASARAAHLHDVVPVVGREFDLDPLLHQLAERVLARPGEFRTLGGVLRRAGVSRSTFARHARDAGFSPPLRFLHLLRVLEAVLMIREGGSSADVAVELGYGSEDTLRRHFREILGVPPRTARHLDPVRAVAQARRHLGAVAQRS